MDFAAFVVWSQQVRHERRDVMVLCETRISRALASLRRAGEGGGGGGTTRHRCDLARDWCRVRALPDAFSPRALVCRGVRHALALLMRDLARGGHAVALPRDVYPVYWNLAATSGVRTVGVETFPRWNLAAVLEEASCRGAAHVLLPYPLKLHGRGWSEQDSECARAWLARSPDRRLWLDGVYSMGMPLGRELVALLATDQVALLDSLSKGWLHEQVFGTAIVPEQDRARHMPAFRDESPGATDLATAHLLLNGAPEAPALLKGEIDRRRVAIEEHLAREGLRMPATTTNGYLIAVEADAQDLLDRHSLLAIPSSVFGSRVRGWSIVSALPATA
jgi:aspartate/methionine/tyrosine aminotransferase